MILPFSVKIVNLAHRQDRRQQCIEELRKAEIDTYSFVDAKYTPGLGYKGCALSQAKAMMDFMFEDDREFLLVLEDDFMVCDNINLKQLINSAISFSNHWDVFMLAHNEAIPIEHTPMQSSQRVINALTASAYIIKKSYVPTMIECFLNASNYIGDYSTLPEPNVWMARHHFCCDVLWRQLQISDVFWAAFPRATVQRASFSDIVNAEVNYGV